MKSIIIFFTLFSTSFFFAQDLSIPDSIISELTTEVYVLNKGADTITLRVRYPEGYSSSMNFTNEGKKKKFPVILALSGGNQSPTIVNYCYAAWFRSELFKNHIIIMPVSKKGENLKNYTNKQIKRITMLIHRLLPVSHHDWTIIGTSNGGVAAFNFVNHRPNQYKSIAVVPGLLADGLELKKSWKNVDVVLAYGSLEDQAWKDGNKKLKKLFEDKANSVQMIILEGQGHILPIGYDLSEVYKLLFD